MAQLVKNPPAMRETWVLSLVWEDLLEKGKATHSSILAWKIPWTTVNGVAKSQTQLTFTFTLARLRRERKKEKRKKERRKTQELGLGIKDDIKIDVTEVKTIVKRIL